MLPLSCSTPPSSRPQPRCGRHASCARVPLLDGMLQNKPSSGLAEYKDSGEVTVKRERTGTSNCVRKPHNRRRGLRPPPDTAPNEDFIRRPGSRTKPTFATVPKKTRGAIIKARNVDLATHILMLLPATKQERFPTWQAMSKNDWVFFHTFDRSEFYMIC